MALDGNKIAFLQLSKRLGLFQLSRMLTRSELRILCYHGAAMRDECEFRPQLFIAPDVFERRLVFLKESGFPVLTLDEGVRRLREGTLPKNATIITIDDGFYGTFKHALPLLVKYGFPATLYVTTYYSQKQAPVFRLLLQYVFWATKKDALAFEGLGLAGFEGAGALSADRENDPLLWRVIRHAEAQLDEPARIALAKEIGRRLEVATEGLSTERILSLMTAEEISQAARSGIDIQLHTHRHRFPVDAALARREIEDNRNVLEPLTGRKLKHFCYPSGEWSEAHLPWLEAMDIESATTCDVGFNALGQNPLSLKRVFDSAEVSDVQFDAEMNGYLELIRRVKAQAKRALAALRP